MHTQNLAEVARAMVVADVESLDPDDRFKLSLQEKFAVHDAFHAGGIAGATAEFYMAVAKSRRRLVVPVENHGERILVDVEALYESAKALGNLDAAFRQAFARQRAAHEVRGPFVCNFAYAHWAEGPMD
ncbi:MAG: hypothetical protein O9318_07815 [Hylemonella sp.]|uniref:hypothetical protein n=1 Tax=Hylemonella sp. TaxID=2066020 RepID=UPI0022CA883E|nr:hypothetical protein [Hylemonella sp.]MCZ8252361.1 hypothetical protein [Hylemonella sp.]